MKRSVLLTLLVLPLFGVAGYYAFHAFQKPADPQAILSTDTVVKYTLRVAMNKEKGIVGTYMLNPKVVYPKGKENDPEILKMAKKVLTPPKGKSATMLGVNTVVEAGGFVVDSVAGGGGTVVDTAADVGCGLLEAGKQVVKQVIVPKLMSGELPKDVMNMGAGAVKAGVLAATSIPQHLMQGMQQMMGMNQQPQQPRVIYVQPAPTGVYQQQYQQQQPYYAPAR